MPLGPALGGHITSLPRLRLGIYVPGMGMLGTRGDRLLCFILARSPPPQQLRSTRGDEATPH